MTTGPITAALAAGDDAELGRIMRTQYGALLASLDRPINGANAQADAHWYQAMLGGECPTDADDASGREAESLYDPMPEHGTGRSTLTPRPCCHQNPSKGGGVGDYYDPAPPTPEEVAEAFRFKYGI